MKIAVVFSSEYPAPAPSNVIVASQQIGVEHAVELKKRGHEVYSIVSSDSTVSTNLYKTSLKSVFNTIDSEKWRTLNDKRLMYQVIVPFEINLLLTLTEFLKKNSVDVIHFHLIKPYLGLPFVQNIDTPCVFTFHSPGTPSEVEVINTFTSKNAYYVALSKYQQLSYPGLTFNKIVNNGFDIDHYAYDEKGGVNLAFLGRFLPEKGLKEAIQTALSSHKNIHIAGEIRYSNKDFFYSIIQPLLDMDKNNINEGLIPHSQISTYLGSKKALLFPIQWEEPFGLVMTESMACGTPVIAFARGSVPEVIQDGVTGFIVNPSNEDIRGNWIIKKTGIEGLQEAVKRLYSLPENEYKQMRKNCRTHVEENFTVEHMVDEYEALYKEIITSSAKS